MSSVFHLDILVVTSTTHIFNVWFITGVLLCTVGIYAESTENIFV